MKKLPIQGKKLTRCEFQSSNKKEYANKNEKNAKEEDSRNDQCHMWKEISNGHKYDQDKNKLLLNQHNSRVCLYGQD